MEPVMDSSTDQTKEPRPSNRIFPNSFNEIANEVAHGFDLSLDLNDLAEEDRHTSLQVTNGLRKRNSEALVKWSDIAREVYLRKAIVLAAKKHLDEELVSAPEGRERFNTLALGATDVFVEKAQSVLTERGDQLRGYAKKCTLWALIVLALGIAFSGFIVLFVPIPTMTGNREFTVYIVRVLTFGGFFVALAHYLITLSKTFTHEAMRLYDLRHGLRFGRLAVYVCKGRITVEELKSAFSWSTTHSSSFDNIEAEKVVKTAFQSIVDSLSSALKSAAKTANETMKRKA